MAPGLLIQFSGAKRHDKLPSSKLNFLLERFFLFDVFTCNFGIQALKQRWKRQSTKQAAKSKKCRERDTSWSLATWIQSCWERSSFPCWLAPADLARRASRASFHLLPWFARAQDDARVPSCWPATSQKASFCPSAKRCTPPMSIVQPSTRTGSWHRRILIADRWYRRAGCHHGTLNLARSLPAQRLWWCQCCWHICEGPCRCQLVHEAVAMRWS